MFAYNGDPTRDMLLPNVAQDKKKVDAVRDEIVVFQSAYMYWPWLFLLSGIFSYLRRALWKSKENGLMAAATKGLESIPESNEALEKAVLQLRHHLGEAEPAHLRSYLKWYWICEILAILNQLGQAWFYNWVLNGELFSYGWNFFVFLHNNNIDKDTMSPLLLLFPRTVSCEWWRYGRNTIE